MNNSRDYFLMGLIFLFLSSFSTQAEEKVRVVDADTNIGIQSRIDLRTVDDKVKQVSATNDDGYLLVEFQCGILETLIVKSKADTHYKKELDCPLKSSIIELSAFYLVTNLVANAENRMAVGDYGSAVLAYSDAESRLSKYEPEKAMELQRHLYEVTGRYLYEVTGKVLNTADSVYYDPEQKKFVMTDELRQALIEFQRASQIESNGQLNFETTSKMSELTLNELLFSSLKEN